MRRFPWITFSVMLISLVFALPAGAQEPLRLYCGAGLKKPMDAVIAEFTQETGIAVQANYGSSGSLSSQIVTGQPCDLFLSADWKFLVDLENKGFVTEKIPYLKDTVVLIVAPSSVKKVTTLQDLSKPGISISLGDSRAPVGGYTINGLKKLGLWTEIQKQNNIKASVTTVNQIIIMVQKDQVDAGLTFKSVASMYGMKPVAEMDNTQTGDIIFGYGLLREGNQKVARQFIEFSKKRIKFFSQYGWTPIP